MPSFIKSEKAPRIDKVVLATVIATVTIRAVVLKM